MNRDKQTYYDLEIDFNSLLIGDKSFDDICDLKDLQQRKIYLNDIIDQDSVEPVVKHILRFNKEDNCLGLEESKRTPILLYITSNGGEVDSGFKLIDVILSSKTPVYTINIGYQYSMGFLIGLAGNKRYAMQHSRFLMHDGTNLVYNSGAKIQDQMRFQQKVEETIKEYVISHSKLTDKEYDEKLRVEWYLFADEAKEKGFVDYIIGVDCDIDEII